jgi:hypothetical protein
MIRSLQLTGVRYPGYLYPYSNSLSVFGCDSFSLPSSLVYFLAGLRVRFPSSGFLNLDSLRAPWHIFRGVGVSLRLCVHLGTSSVCRCKPTICVHLGTSSVCRCKPTICVHLGTSSLVGISLQFACTLARLPW